MSLTKESNIFANLGHSVFKVSSPSVTAKFRLFGVICFSQQLLNLAFQDGNIRILSTIC